MEIGREGYLLPNGAIMAMGNSDEDCRSQWASPSEVVGRTGHGSSAVSLRV